jgi:hypothetical protein
MPNTDRICMRLSSLTKSESVCSACSSLGTLQGHVYPTLRETIAEYLDANTRPGHGL